MIGALVLAALFVVDGGDVPARCPLGYAPRASDPRQCDPLDQTLANAAASAPLPKGVKVPVELIADDVEIDVRHAIWGGGGDLLSTAANLAFNKRSRESNVLGFSPEARVALKALTIPFRLHEQWRKRRNGNKAGADKNRKLGDVFDAAVILNNVVHLILKK